MRARAAEAFAALSLACLAVAPAAAQSARFDIPPVDSATLIALAGQADHDRLPAIPASPQSDPGRCAGGCRFALRCEAAGGDRLRFRFTGPGAVRIVRAAPATAAAAGACRLCRRPPTSSSPPANRGRARKLGGTVHLLDLQGQDVGRLAKRGTAAVLARLPMPASTSLGPGCNKIFIRGVADRASTAEAVDRRPYLGDVRLTFNAPDPDLQLYDIGRVELLEGPQGALYGTTSLGGILRLVPNPPDPSRTQGAISAGCSPPSMAIPAATSPA